MAEVLQFPSAAVLQPRIVSDAQARIDALDTRASCIVEAPAGSGKTGLLVQRYLRLLSEEAVANPEEVLAITFTNKATAELRERVLEHLQAVSGDALPESAPEFERETRMLAQSVVRRSAQLGWELLERPSRLNIRSIDSVCAEIANALPLLSEGGLPRKPVEDADPLYRLAARRTLLQLGGPAAALSDAIRTVLLHRDGSLKNCEMLLAKMLAEREQWGELVPLSSNMMTDAELDEVVRVKLERSLERIVCSGLTRAMHLMPQDVLEDLTKLAAQLSVCSAFKLDESPIALCHGRNEPPEAVVDHLEHWRALIGLVLTKGGDWRKSCSRSYVGFDIPKSHQSRLEDLVHTMHNDPLREALCAVRALPPAKYPEDQWVVTKALFHLLRRSLAELKVIFAESGECDFSELALAARTALRSEQGASDISLAAGGRLRHLLVDEMQDTSSGQYELLELLTQSWDGQTQTLFLVGDPKQSIYLFRQARVERFLRTMQERRLGSIVLKPLHLTSNFRSQAALVDNFNHAFELLFPGADDARLLNSEGVDVPFTQAVAIRSQTLERGVVWHPAILAAADSSKEHAIQEAHTIRRLIEQRMAMPLPQERRDPLRPQPWRIAVLARARSHLAAVIAEFKRDDGNGTLPFRGIDLDPLDLLPEVLDALSLTRALLHPSDRIAWLAVLHAPWCGLGIADLLALTGEGEDADSAAPVAVLVRRRKDKLSSHGRLLLERAWPVLEAALATLGRTPLATHVERTWSSLGADAALSREQRSNVMRYLRVLREVESEGGRVDMNALSSRLERLYAEPLSGVMVNGLLPVDLMTIHKAKGLEWDMVLVPGLERGGGASQAPLLNWLEFDGDTEDEDCASVILAPIGQKGAESDTLSKWLGGVRARRENAERKRVFYVAATRAREELHLFGAAGMKAGGELSAGRWDSLLTASWPAAAQHFEEFAVPVGPVRWQMEPEGDQDGAPLSLAASSEASTAAMTAPRMIQRLPLSFDAAARFRQAASSSFAAMATASPQLSVAFDRPEGSFGARAFGNVVHRYLESISKRLDLGQHIDGLLAELPSWNARLIASLRGEGVPPGFAIREADRAQRALMQTLRDPTGRWILSPQAASASESTLTLAAPDTRSLRVDRTFLGGDEPLSAGQSCIWIVDFKTAEQGLRSDESFEAAEIAKYSAQLETYARIRRTHSDGGLPIRLGLFYPLVPRLIHWLSAAPEEPSTI
jgi:ATP-dependent exoDNAse (exonuclease V) beta subunit